MAAARFPIVLATLASLRSTATATPTVVTVEDLKRATLPVGLVLEVKGDELIVRRGKLQTPVFHVSPWRGPCPDGTPRRHGTCGFELDGVVLGDDGVLTVDLGWGGTLKFRPGELDAWLEVAVAAKQTSATAIATLEHALTLDPLLWEAARELAIRHLAARHADLAAETIAVWLRRGELIAGYARLLADAALRSVLDRPAIAALRAPTPGKLQAKTLSVAWSATLDAAIEVVEHRVNTSGHRGWDESEPVVLFQHPDATEPALTVDKRERATLERLLRDFDARVDPGAQEVSRVESNSADQFLELEAAKLTVKLEIPSTSTGSYVRKDNSIRVVDDDDHVIARSRCSLISLTSATWLPAARAMIVKNREGGSAGVDELCVIRVP